MGACPGGGGDEEDGLFEGPFAQVGGDMVVEFDHFSFSFFFLLFFFSSSLSLFLPGSFKSWKVSLLY